MAEMDEAGLEACVEKTYLAYVDALGGRDDSGRPLPLYADLHALHKGAWRQAVLTALTPPPAAPVAASTAPHADTEGEGEDDAPRTGGRRRG